MHAISKRDRFAELTCNNNLQFCQKWKEEKTGLIFCWRWTFENVPLI